jgi:hypothetical protein
VLVPSMWTPASGEIQVQSPADRQSCSKIQ